ncbi:MAG: EAL domain-containing protein [Clostridia bacterium]
MEETILIVDDSYVNRKLLSEIMSFEYNIIEAENGKEALQILLENKISAIMLDIDMPVMNGFEFLDNLAKDSVNSEIPVFVSTSLEEESQIKLLEHGITDYLTKPYNAKVILHRVRNNIRRVELDNRLNKLEIDPLTQVYNIDSFYRYASKKIKNSAANERFYAAVINIRSFKMINTKYGFNYANKVLKEFASVNKEIIASKGGMVGRISGDNFAVLFDDKLVLGKEELFNRINERMYNLVSENDFSYCFGIYVIDDKNMDINIIFDRAMLAVRSITDKYDNYCYYNEDMSKALEEERFLVESAEKGITQKDFKVFFQPKYNIETDIMIGAEALIRWIHPTLGNISPAIFIPIFEKNGFVGMVDMFVWEEVCKEIKKCKEKGIDIPPISINVSRKDLFDKDFINNIMELLEKYDILPSDVHLEITETAYMENQAIMKNLIKQFINKGFYLEMDDFGSGYSSLNMLNEAEFNLLKIDMIFMRNLTNRNKVSLIPYIMDIAKALQMEVLVEGVETQAQLEILKCYGCRYVQGFLYSKPLSIRDFEKLLEK